MPRELLTQEMLDKVTEAPEGYKLEKIPLDTSIDPLSIRLVLVSARKRYTLLARVINGKRVNSFFAITDGPKMTMPRRLDDLMILADKLIIR